MKNCRSDVAYSPVFNLTRGPVPQDAVYELAGLAFLVVLCYLMRKVWNVKFVIVPLSLLLILPACAMTGFVIDWC